MAFQFSQDVKPLNLEKYLGKVRNRVDRVGIELEGGWRTGQLPPNIAPHNDGSVFKNQPASYWRANRFDMKGEIASPVMLPVQAASWMRKHYPFFVDSSCGLHIHMSWEDNTIYARLMAPEFPLTVLKYVKLWAEEENLPKTHCLWDRLADESKFCQHKFWPDKQVELAKAGTAQYYSQERVGSRYTIVNYCYRLHGTLEHRVLPMFSDPEQGIRAIQRLIDITNASTVALAKRAEKVSHEVFSSGESFEERDELII